MGQVAVLCENDSCLREGMEFMFNEEGLFIQYIYIIICDSYL